MYTRGCIAGLQNYSRLIPRENYYYILQVKDNREGLFNVSYRLEHLLRALEINRQHKSIRSEDYTDALTTISMYDS